MCRPSEIGSGSRYGSTLAQLIEQAAKESGDMYVKRPPQLNSITPTARAAVEFAHKSGYAIRH